MTTLQKTIKYCAIAFAMFLSITIITAIVSAILGIVGAVGFATNVNNVVNQATIDYSKNFNNIDSLDISIDAASFNIKLSDGFKVEASNVSDKFVSEDQNGKLVIKEDTNTKSIFGFISMNNSPSVTLYLPANFISKSTRIKTGIGEVNIEQLNSDLLDLELGVGELHAAKLISSNADIKGGVGEIDIKNADLKNLKLKNGLGETKISGKILGTSDINCGIGAVSLNIDGNRSNYKITAKSGIGSIKVNGEKYSSADNSDKYLENSIDIEGGIGEVTVDFSNK